MSDHPWRAEDLDDEEGLDDEEDSIWLGRRLSGIG
jgi:hypothetical protein